MAGRPIKNNADYFSHDADMRNDMRVKALRRKFKHEGYSVYNMLIEVLTDSEGFKYELSELNYELISGDFDIDLDDLKQIIKYLVTLDLFQIIDNFLTCKTLDNRFEGLLSKRKRQRGELSPTKIQDKSIIVSENTHSKVKESKEEKSKEEYNDYSFENSFNNAWDLYPKKSDQHSAEIIWSELLESDHIRIIEHIPKYSKNLIENNVKRQFILKFANYLRDRCWESDLPYQNETDQNEKVNAEMKRLYELEKRE